MNHHHFIGAGWKRTVVRLLACASMAAALAGCYTMGNRKLDDVGNYLTLREQQSTKDDVYANFGQPHDVRETESGATVWVYYKIHARMSGWTFVPIVGMFAGGDARQTTFAYFSFDSTGVLQKVHSETGNDYQNMWAGLGRTVKRTFDKTQADRVHDEMDRMGHPFDPEIADSVSVLRDDA